MKYMCFCRLIHCFMKSVITTRTMGSVLTPFEKLLGHLFLFITFFYLLQGGEVHCVECFSRLHLSVAIVIALSFGAEYAKSREEIMLLNKSKQNCCDAYICDYAFVYKREHGFKAYNTLE